MADPTVDRVRIARHLADHGPTPGDDLAAALRLSPERFWGLVNHPWFDITGGGWRLTDRGRAEAFPAAGDSLPPAGRQSS